MTDLLIGYAACLVRISQDVGFCIVASPKSFELKEFMIVADSFFVCLVTIYGRGPVENTLFTSLRIALQYHRLQDSSHRRTLLLLISAAYPIVTTFPYLLHRKA